MAAVELLETFEFRESNPTFVSFRTRSPDRFVTVSLSASDATHETRRAVGVTACSRDSLSAPHSWCSRCRATSLVRPTAPDSPTTWGARSVLASGMDYVVQPGDTVSSIARSMNPNRPREARALLVHELGSSVVVPGEHVLIP